MQTVRLYHIRRKVDQDDLSKGYIGVCDNPATQWLKHYADESIREALNTYNDIEMIILDSGPVDYIIDMEKSLRPRRGMGWNRFEGGSTESLVGSVSIPFEKKLSDIGKTKVGHANNNSKGWWEVDGERYESLSIAGEATGVKWPTIRKRALSSNFPTYKFIPKES